MLSLQVAFQGNNIVLCNLPEFWGKTEKNYNFLLRQFVVKALTDFVSVDDEEWHLCPVLAVFLYGLSQGCFSLTQVFVCVSQQVVKTHPQEHLVSFPP